MTARPSLVNLISIETFANKVYELNEPTDIKLDTPEIVLKENALRINDMPLSALALYQLKSLTSSDARIGGYESISRSAKLGDEPARRELTVMANSLNNAIRSSNRIKGDVIARVVDNRIGGIVTGVYAPVTHRELLDAIMKSPSMREVQVAKWTASPAEIGAQFVFPGEAWAVDGGLKRGMVIHNGQFGDRSYGFKAMLFRLRCTNGLMDVIKSVGSGRRRHYNSGSIDIAADVVESIGRADDLFARAERAMTVEVDVEAALIELLRRGFLQKSSAKLARNLISETFEGETVTGYSTTLWGLAQAITASARKYAFAGSDSMGTVAGSIILADSIEAVYETRPVPANAMTEQEVREYFAEE